MKMGIRTPNFKKSLKAKTVGKYKRAAKRAINPTYGKKGARFIKNPQKAIYNQVYRETTIDGLAPVKKASQKSQQEATANINKKAVQNPACHKNEKSANIVIKNGGGRQKSVISSIPRNGTIIEKQLIDIPFTIE